MVAFEGPEHLADDTDLISRIVDQCPVTDANVSGELQLGLRFGSASRSDPKEMSEGASFSSPTGTLGDVRWNRHGRSPQLRRETKPLIRGEPPGQFVDVDDELSTGLPDLQLSVVMHTPQLPDGMDGWNPRDLRCPCFRTQYAVPLRIFRYNLLSRVRSPHVGHGDPWCPVG